MQQAGIKDYKFIDWYREHPLEDDLKLLKWSDEQLAGEGHVDWYEFDHPQLGKIELGGWNSLHTFRNPPKQFVAKEIEPFPKWLIWHLLISPQLSLHTAEARALGEGVYLVRLAVQNEGWLPTYITKNALARKVVRGIICEIDLPDGATLQSGKVRQDLGQLEGRAYKPAAPTRYARDFTDDRALVEWVVHAPQGGTVKLIAKHDRAGVVRADLALTA